MGAPFDGTTPGHYNFFYYSIDKKDQLKSVGKHFFHISHFGLDDVEIHVLEFIKKPPNSEIGALVRNMVEKRWIHVLKISAPKGMNIND